MAGCLVPSPETLHHEVAFSLALYYGTGHYLPGGGGVLQNLKIMGPKLLAHPLTAKWKLFASPSSISLELQATITHRKKYSKTCCALPSAWLERFSPLPLFVRVKLHIPPSHFVTPPPFLIINDHSLRCCAVHSAPSLLVPPSQDQPSDVQVTGLWTFPIGDTKTYISLQRKFSSYTCL